MTESITVAFFHIDSENPGGGSKMLLRLLENIDKNRFNPVLIVQNRGDVFDEVKAMDIEVEIISFPGILNTYNRQLLSSSALAKFMIGGRILQYNLKVVNIVSKADVIWYDSLRMVLTLLPATILSFKPTIWNIGLGMKSEGTITQLNEVALRTVNHVFIESEEQAKRMFTTAQYNRHAAKFTVFHKGIDTSRLDPQRVENSRKSNTFTIGTAASITPRKGIGYLIDALPMILEEHADVRLTIAGTAPDGH